MRGALLRALAGIALFGAALPPAGAQALSELEAAARANATAVRIAREHAMLQQYRLDATEAQRGARFNAGVGVADVREPVTDAALRDYRRASAQIGARWPLLEGAQVQERAHTDARGALEVARLRAIQAEIDAVRELRLAYVDHRHASERLALAEALAQLEPGVAPVLAARTRQSFLLEADRRELQTIFDLARRDVQRARALREDAQRRMRRLSAIAQAEPVLAPPRWDTSCLAAPPLLARADERPAVALAAIELATRKSLANQLQWTGVDAGVSLTQSLSRDVGGLSGRSSGVSVDLTVPFGWRALRDARKAEAESGVRRAHLELDAAREADAAVVDQLVRDLQVRAADRIAALKRLDAAHEALRVAEARLRRLDGDVIEKVLQARHGVYVTAVEASDTLQRLERAQAELLSVAEPCSAVGSAIEPAQWQALPAMLARPIVAVSASAARGPGWYVWNAAPWLAAPVAMLAELPTPSERVLLGMNAAQLRAFATASGAQAVRELVAQAHERGVRVELLLGDPEWVLAHGRERLLGMLRPIADLPFDAINLDLERDQLPPAQRRQWASGVVATIAAVHATVRWPVGLSTHDRDLLDPETNRRLQAAGTSELIALAYVTRRERAVQRVRAVLAAAPGLRVAIGQSVERELPPESSLSKRGRAAALAQAAALARDLADPAANDPRFSGVVVQSFEAFRDMEP